MMGNYQNKPPAQLRKEKVRKTSKKVQREPRERIESEN